MEILNTWLQPAVIVAAIVYANRLTFNSLGKRIDDLRSQMAREHDILSKKVDTLTEIIMKHITDHSIHGTTEPQQSSPE